MVYSKLVTSTRPTSKSSVSPAVKDRVIVHHWAGTSLAVALAELVTKANSKSVNYLVQDQQIIGSVPEERRAWTSGSAAYDNLAVTFECGNSGGAPDWPMSDATFNSLARLIAEIADRRGWPPLTVGWRAGGIIGHRDVPGQSTACPGPWMYARLGALAKLAQSHRSTGGDDLPTVQDVWNQRIFGSNFGGKEGETVIQVIADLKGELVGLRADVAKLQAELDKQRSG